MQAAWPSASLFQLSVRSAFLGMVSDIQRHKFLQEASAMEL